MPPRPLTVASGCRGDRLTSVDGFITRPRVRAMSYDISYRIASKTQAGRDARHRDRFPADLDGSFKRSIDILVALTCLVLLSPLMIVIGLLVMWSTGTTCIYKHRRVGRNGQPFNCYKFQ